MRMKDISKVLNEYKLCIQQIKNSPDIKENYRRLCMTINNLEEDSLTRFLSEDKDSLGFTVVESIQQSIEKALGANIKPGSFKDLLFATVYIPDVHGNLEGLLEILFSQGLIDKKGNWKGKQRVVVQEGDLIDRGPKSWETILYMRILQKQAKYEGGEVILLLGNHEQAILEDRSIEPQNFYFQIFKENSHFNYDVSEEEKQRQKYLLKCLLNLDILKGNLKSHYFDRMEYPLLVLHAGLPEADEQERLLKCYLEERGREVNLGTVDETSYNIFNRLREHNCDFEDFYKWLDVRLDTMFRERYLTIKDVLTLEMFEHENIFGMLGITWTRLHLYSCMKKKESELSRVLEKDELVILVGHTDTLFEEGMFSTAEYAFRHHETDQKCKRLENVFYNDMGIWVSNLGCNLMQDGIFYVAVFESNRWILTERLNFKEKKLGMMRQEKDFVPSMQ